MFTTTSSLKLTAPVRVQRAQKRALSIVAFKNSDRDNLTSRQSDVGSYLSKSLVSIFTPTHTSKDLKFPVTPFSGRIHHTDKSRLGTLYHTVRELIRASEGAKIDTRVRKSTADLIREAREAADAQTDSEVKQYLEGAISNLFAHNFVGDATEPNWMVTPFSGKIMSQRDINDLLVFERVVKTAMKRVDEIAATESQSKKGLHRDM